jgi:cobalt-zinc-cadmium efflux system membrane fusion protein
MRQRLNKKWLVMLIVVLGAAGFWGWRHSQAGHEHEGHLQQGQVHQDHDHDHGAEEAHQETPVAGRVKLTPEAVKQAGIETAQAELGPWDIRVALTGELVFNEEHLARIRSRVPGRVVQISADYGQGVKPGSVLAIIDSIELSQAHMSCRQATARVNASQKAYERACQLYEGKAISLAELQERQARLEVERAELKNAQSRLRLLGAAGAMPLPKGFQAGSKTSVAADPEAVFALRSPIAGRVVDRKITPGLVVKEDEELFTVADTSTLWCFVQIPEKDLPLIHVGSQAMVTASSLPGDQFTGKVDYLADMVDKASRTVRARVRVHNPQNRLKAGMFVDIAVRVGPRQALSIPENAVLAANGENFVFVAMVSGIYQRHLVKTGAKGGGRTEILAGLEAGEPVVVQGGFTLKSELEKGGSGGGLRGTCGHAH